jgi:inorganic pyrophosphatase
MSTSIDQVPVRAPEGGYNVVVETPRGSRVKFAYEPAAGLFRARKLLALGFAFPWPFGFFPSTLAEDGDPLDVLILTELDLPMGSVVRCNLVGGLAIEEEPQPGQRRRNDRLLAVPLFQHQHRPPRAMSDLGAAELAGLEDFLTGYQRADGKAVRVVGRLDQSQAETVVDEAARTFGAR